MPRLLAAARTSRSSSPYEGPHTVAAVILETVVGTNGIIVPPDGYLQSIREVCDRHGILLICDEVMAGFGRTGRWFACEHWDVLPDMITSAKGINSGYVPLGALTVRQHDLRRDQGPVLRRRPHLLRSSARLRGGGRIDRGVQGGGDRRELRRDGRGARLRAAEAAERHPSVGDVRGLGLFWGVELVRNRETREMLVPYNAGGEAAAPIGTHGQGGAGARPLPVRPLERRHRRAAADDHARGARRRRWRFSTTCSRSRTSTTTADLAALAEDIEAILPTFPSVTRDEQPDCILLDNETGYPGVCAVHRIRLRPETVDKRITEARSWFRERGREQFTWWIGPSATPPDLEARLLEDGARPFPDEPTVTSMVATEPPPVVGDVEVKKVERFEDFVVAREIGWDASDFDEERREALRTVLPKRWEQRVAVGHSDCYLAFVEGEPVASADTIFLPFGVFLSGAATREDARGRGAYRALVRARWDEAARRGTPALIVGAGKMSRPILERIGFRPVAETHLLLDSSG